MYRCFRLEMAQVRSRHWCCVPMCFNNKQKHPYMSFHALPVDDERRKIWLREIRREGSLFNAKRATICSMHFSSSDIVTSLAGRKMIKKDAVPSLFPWDSGKPLVRTRVKSKKKTKKILHYLAGSCGTDAVIVKDSVGLDHDYVLPIPVEEEKEGDLAGSSSRTSPEPEDEVGGLDSTSSLPSPASPASLPEESQCPTAQERALRVPLSSLRLCVPPLRMLSALMWRVAEQHLVKYYSRLEEFVSDVLEVLPDLLTAKKRAELLLGLRAKFILELCRDESSVNIQALQPHLDRLHSIAKSASDQNGDPMVDSAVKDFCSLIQTILTDPQERTNFFQDIYPLRYGHEYDAALKSMVWEFLCRLEKLLPMPSFQQVASWLDEDALQSKDSTEMEPKAMQNFLHHVQDGLFDPVSSSSPMKPNTILSTLATTSATLRSPCEPPGALKRVSNLPEPQTSVSRNRRSNVDRARDGCVVGKGDDADGENPNDEDAQRSVDKGREKTLGQKSSTEGNQAKPNGYASNQENTRSSSRSVKRPSRAAGGDTVAFSPSEAANQSTVTTTSDQTVRTKSGPPHICPVCGKLCRTPYLLAYHTRVHTGEKPYACSVCGKRFSCKGSLRVHKRRHTGEKPFVCPVCGRGFSTSGALKSHSKVHAEERSLSCEVCGKSFTRACSLSLHRRAHAKKRRTYPCLLCDKRFNTSSLLKRHKQTHAPFECFVCGKRFSAAVSREIHQRVHR